MTHPKLNAELLKCASKPGLHFPNLVEMVSRVLLLYKLASARTDLRTFGRFALALD